MLKIIFKDLVTFIIVEYNHLRGERVDGHQKVVIDSFSQNVQGSRISKPASKTIKSPAEAIVLRNIAKTFSRYSWVEYMIGIFFYVVIACTIVL